MQALPWQIDGSADIRSRQSIVYHPHPEFLELNRNFSNKNGSSGLDVEMNYQPAISNQQMRFVRQ